MNANGDRVEDDVIARNHPGRTAPIHGGVVLLDLFGAAPSSNTITSNDLIRDRPNVFSDGSAHGNAVSNNHCVPSC